MNLHLRQSDAIREIPALISSIDQRNFKFSRLNDVKTVGKTLFFGSDDSFAHIPSLGASLTNSPCRTVSDQSEVFVVSERSTNRTSRCVSQVTARPLLPTDSEKSAEQFFNERCSTEGRAATRSTRV